MSPIYTPGKLTLAKTFTWNETVWNPSMITTALWLDAADNTTVFSNAGTTQAVAGTSTVQQWNDKSGNGRHATQSTSGNRPTYALAAQNSLNAMRFSAPSQQFMAAGTNSTWNFLHNGTEFAVFIAAKCRSTGDDPNAVHAYLSTGAGSPANAGFGIAYNDAASSSRNNALDVRVAGASATEYVNLNITNDKITPGAYHIISSYIDADNATAANRSRQRVDGSADFSSNANTLAPSVANSTYALTLGRDQTSATLDYTGDLCEILIFNNQPDANTRQRIEGYLAHKWGLTANLPSDHPYKTVGPTP